MTHRFLTRFARAIGIVGAVAVLAHPAHAAAGEPNTIELRIAVRSDSLPAVMAAFTPGGSLKDLTAEITGLRTDGEVTPCGASITTPSVGDATATPESVVTLDTCAGAESLRGAVALVPANGVARATVDYEGVTASGTGTTDISIVGIIIVIIIIIILVCLPSKAH